MTKTDLAVEVSNLHMRFGSLEVLKGISLSARQGDVIAIIGGSGSGKSTLLRCINLLEQPTSGTLTIQGETIAMRVAPNGTMAPTNLRQVQRIRSRLAMVFQTFNLWQHLTVFQNVVEAPIRVLGKTKQEAASTADALLRRVGLQDKRNAYPAFLSGGQQQRAAIARALAMDPQAMLFDEPTSALDPELVGEVLSVIVDLASEKRTMLLVTHEMEFARRVASHVVFLKDGVIEEQGEPDQLFYSPRSKHLQRFLKSMS
ncbi:MAG: ATP-binding cassette domain-containing protein [Mesorhizobium sp.]|nr:MAG: ATP-binding cassette domain-containing protein [Mesorhizobium sp.]